MQPDFIVQMALYMTSINLLFSFSLLLLHLHQPFFFFMNENERTNKQLFTSRSPLRYPGGKTRGISFITQYFPGNITQMLSPFFGGGSIELFMAAQGVHVIGFDVFSSLAEFWQCLQESPELLAEEIATYHPLSKENFYHLQTIQTHFITKIKRAAVYYVLNRSSFSGATLSGGMSPEHPRFTQSAIGRIRTFYNPNFSVHQASFEESLSLHQNMFCYLDPPYLIKSSLYGKKGNAHKDFNHQALAVILLNRNNWILSYNDCEEIRSLYNNFRIVVPEWKYGMSNNKFSKEILILSNDLG